MTSAKRLLGVGGVLLVLNLVMILGERHLSLHENSIVAWNWLAQVLFWLGVVCVAVGLLRVTPAER